MVFGFTLSGRLVFCVQRGSCLHLSQKPHGCWFPIQAIAGATINKVLPEGGRAVEAGVFRALCL